MCTVDQHLPLGLEGEVPPSLQGPCRCSTGDTPLGGALVPAGLRQHLLITAQMCLLAVGRANNEVVVPSACCCAIPRTEVNDWQTASRGKGTVEVLPTCICWGSHIKLFC